MPKLFFYSNFCGQHCGTATGPRHELRHCAECHAITREKRAAETAALATPTQQRAVALA